ncbi:MAG TPA: hypothetical protein DHW14_09445 [Clostridiales bacterium]|nr:hypothetical protein [Clostridiales bacterium]
MAYRGEGRWRIARENTYTWPSVVVGLFLVAVGLFMVGRWVGFVLAGNMPEGLWTVENDRYLVFRIGAEGTVALLAVLGGLGLLRGRPWGTATALVALGGLLHSTVDSLGFSLLSVPESSPLLLGVLGGVLLSFVGLHFGRR